MNDKSQEKKQKLNLNSEDDNIQQWVFPDLQKSFSGSNFSPVFQTDNEKKLSLTDEEINKLKEEVKAELRAQLAAEVKLEWDSKLQRLENLLQNVAEPLRLITNEVEEQIGLLVRSLVERIIKREIDDKNKDLILSLIQQARTLLPINQTQVDIYLHPDDLEEVQAELQNDATAKIKVDNNLSCGECYLRTQSSEVDASFKARIQQLCDQVFGDEH